MTSPRGGYGEDSKDLASDLLAVEFFNQSSGESKRGNLPLFVFNLFRGALVSIHSPE
jgi:hypothetical protein